MIPNLEQFPLSPGWQLDTFINARKCHFLKRCSLPLCNCHFIFWLCCKHDELADTVIDGTSQDWTAEIKRLLVVCDMDLQAHCPEVKSPKNTLSSGRAFQQPGTSCKMCWLCLKRPTCSKNDSWNALGKTFWSWCQKTRVWVTALLGTNCGTEENPPNSNSVSLLIH